MKMSTKFLYQSHKRILIQLSSSTNINWHLTNSRLQKTIKASSQQLNIRSIVGTKHVLRLCSTMRNETPTIIDWFRSPRFRSLNWRLRAYRELYGAANSLNGSIPKLSLQSSTTFTCNSLPLSST